MATITPISAGGNTAVTYAAASAGGDVVATGTSSRTVFLVRNAGSSITVTLTAVNACSQGVLHNVVITCPAGDTEILIPPNCETTTGNCSVTYSSVTSVTIAAINN